MKIFVGLVLFCGGLALLPIPATILFGVSYGTAWAAMVVGVSASLILSMGVGLLKG